MILCSDKRKCPQLEGLQIIDAKTIKQYEGNPEVEALICSRDVAQVCQHMNFPNLKVIQLFSAGFDDIDASVERSSSLQCRQCI